jgi:hypothetical protein
LTSTVFGAEERFCSTDGDAGPAAADAAGVP